MARKRPQAQEPEAQPAQEQVQQPAHQPAVAPSGPAVRRWSVQLPSAGALIVEAPDEAAAIALHDQINGVLGSVHAHIVTPLE
jgi:hypothetical protein